MGEYFKPLRRKLGVVTLMMATAFAVGWVRSFSASSDLRFPNAPPTDFYSKRPQYAVISTPVGLTFEKRSFFNAGDTYAIQSETNILAQFTVPYVTIVGMLVLLSAYLLLSKPRAKSQSSQPAAKVNA